MREVDETQADAELERILVEHDSAICKSCGRHIDRGDVAWNGASTEAGTDYSVLQITCLNCGTEIVHLFSWVPGIDNFAEFVNILEREWD